MLEMSTTADFGNTSASHSLFVIWFRYFLFLEHNLQIDDPCSTGLPLSFSVFLRPHMDRFDFEEEEISSKFMNYRLEVP